MAGQHEFVSLFMPIQGDLLAYILAMGVSASDADDVLQSAAAVMLDKIGSFRSGTNFRAWAFSVTRIEVLKLFERGAPRALKLDEAAMSDIEHVATHDDEVQSVHLKALTVCVEKLPTRSKSLVEMRYREDLNVRSIAERLRRPVESVYTTLSRVRRSLRECVERSMRREAEPA